MEHNLGWYEMANLEAPIMSKLKDIDERYEEIDVILTSIEFYLIE